MLTRWCAALALLGSILAASACGSRDKCERACRKMESCAADAALSVSSENGVKKAAAGAEGRTGPRTGCDAISSCSARDACRAACILEASCSEVLGRAASFISCQAGCASTTPPETDGGARQRSDGSPFVIIGEAAACRPSCDGRQCGSDGCGGSCGSCGASATCSASGSCIAGAPDSNSGKICTDATPCPTGERCMGIPGAPPTKGMCLGSCNVTGDACSTPGPGQLSFCALTSQTDGADFCIFICEVAGKTYSCPSSYDYSCIVVDPTQPSVKFCAPK